MGQNSPTCPPRINHSDGILPTPSSPSCFRTLAPSALLPFAQPGLPAPQESMHTAGGDSVRLSNPPHKTYATLWRSLREDWVQSLWTQMAWPLWWLVDLLPWTNAPESDRLASVRQLGGLSQKRYYSSPRTTFRTWLAPYNSVVVKLPV